MKVSIVIEWENVILSEAERAFALLRTIGEQVRDAHGTGLEPPVEVIVLYGDDRIDVPALQASVDGSLGTDAALESRLVHAPGLGYYELKNHGAELARGEVVVLVDSDVALHDGWFEGIVAPFANADIDVVTGYTYADPTGFVGKAFATFWMFPYRYEGELRVTTVKQFYANNLAFRRQVFLRHPFPPLEGATRGACRRLAQQLTESGIPIYRTTAAQAHHPPPNGFRHFLIRALAHGRDDVINARVWGSTRNARIGRAIGRIPRGIGRPLRHRDRVGLSWPGALAAAFLAGSFNSLRVAGNLLTRVAPGMTRRVWQI